MQLEISLGEQYDKKEMELGPRFDPIRIIEKTSFDSDLSSHFGTGTFRLPSTEECDKPELFTRYMNLIDVHEYKAYLFGLTRNIASYRFYAKKLRETGEEHSRIKKLIEKMEHLKAQAISDKKITISGAVESRAGAVVISERAESEDVRTIPPRIE